MATATARAPQPGKQKGRPLAGGGLSRNFVNSNSASANSIASYRSQYLRDRYGFSEPRADLIATLAFGGAA